VVCSCFHSRFGRTMSRRILAARRRDGLG